MKVIFRPASASAAAAKPDAIKLAESLSGGEGVANRMINGVLLRAIGNGNRIIVYAIDQPIILALGVHGFVRLGLKVLDGLVFYEPGIMSLLSPASGFVAPMLEYGQHSKTIEVVTIGGPFFVSPGDSIAHYAGYSLENARSLTTTKARYLSPTLNNPFRKPYLVINRAAAALGAGAETDNTGTFGLLSSLGRVQISIESLGTPDAGTDIVPGDALEWGPAFGCGYFLQSGVSGGYLVFYKITEQTDPSIKLVGEVQSLVSMVASGFSASSGITSATAMTGQFADDADRAVYFISTKDLPEVQETVIHGLKEDTRTPTASPCGGKWYLDDGGSAGAEAFPQDFTYIDADFIRYKVLRETYLVKALPDGTVTSAKLSERWAIGPSSGSSSASFFPFPDGYELSKIGAVLAPEVDGQLRQALIIAIRTTYATVETPEVPVIEETIVPLWTCGVLSEGVVLPKYPGHPAVYTPTANTYELAYSSGPIAIIREDGAMQVVNIPGYMPVGADNRGGETGGTTVPRHSTMRYRSVACEYAADYFCVLVTPIQPGFINKQAVPWDFHVAVIHKVTGVLYAVTPALGTYPKYPGQIAISCVEQGIFAEGAVTQHARLLISVITQGSMLNSTTLTQPTTIYMLPDLTALVAVATTDYFAEAHYLGNAIAPAKVGRSTGMSGTRTGIGPVTPP